MAQFSFERGVYTFSEGDSNGLQIHVEIVNAANIQIPKRNSENEAVSISLTATIEPSSNATRGLTPLHHHYIIITSSLHHHYVMVIRSLAIPVQILTTLYQIWI